MGIERERDWVIHFELVIQACRHTWMKPELVLQAVNKVSTEGNRISEMVGLYSLLMLKVWIWNIL